MATYDDLLAAVNGGDAEKAKALLAANPRIAIRPATGQSVLLAAMYRGRQDLVALLLPHIQPDIFEAAALGDVQRVKQLAQQDRNMLRGYTLDGWTALHLAGFMGQGEAAAALLELGASLTDVSKNEMANQPLHAALAGKRDQGLVEMLLGRGADVSARGASGVTPLHLAASRGDGELCEMLIGKGADPAAKMDDGTTPEEIARKRGHEGVGEQIRKHLSR
ncbi:MAG TPA: ankyrin repeat domain-containing protein [Tepidisphaeraceae bacterium]|jgi:ankyrin repeat protein|nr:ankyrin repeat domain-containing protein [Tepidisphaeraceae bacterium]